MVARLNCARSARSVSRMPSVPTLTKMCRCGLAQVGVTVLAGGENSSTRWRRHRRTHALSGVTKSSRLIPCGPCPQPQESSRATGDGPCRARGRQPSLSASRTANWTSASSIPGHRCIDHVRSAGDPRAGRTCKPLQRSMPHLSRWRSRTSRRRGRSTNSRDLL